MSDDVFYIKRGDTSPDIKYALEPTDLVVAGAQVRFQVRNSYKKMVMDEPAVWVTETPPVAGYSWQTGDTDSPGTYEAEFKVIYPGGKVETFPNSGFITLVVGEDVS